MKKTILITILLVLFHVSVAMAQITFERTYGGAEYEKGYSVQQTSDGGYIITGCTKSFGPSAGDYHSVYLIKTDASGDTLWTKAYGGTISDCGYSVQETSDSGYIVAGRTRSFGAGSYDVYLIKTDASGDTLWTKAYGGTDGDESFSVQQTSDGGYIVAGWTFLLVPPPGSPHSDVYLIKTDTDGDTLWTRTYGGADDDESYSVQETSDEGYIIVGYTKSFGAGYKDVYLIKTNTDGDTLWTRTYGGTYSDYGYSVQQTLDGGYIIGGYTTLADYTSDVYLIKTDASGDTLWTRTYGSTDDDEGYSVQQTSDGGYIIAGNTKSFGSGEDDVYLIKTNTDGDTLWTRTFGGANSDYGNSVQQTNDGGYIIAGSFGYADWSSDVYLIKLAGVGDFNSDGYVDAADLQLLGDHWHFVNTTPGWDPLYDLVPDNIIDAADLQVFGDHWHEGTQPTRSGQGESNGRGPNENAGIVFDLDATTSGNQNLTVIPSQPVGTYIRVDVYCTDVVNLDTYEFEVIYNPEELEYVTSTPTNPITIEGNILESNGGTALGWMVDTSTPGVLSIAYTLAGNDPLEAPEGEGLIADILFLSLVDTYGTLSFGDVYYYDSYGVVDLITDKGTASIGGGEVVTLPIPDGNPVNFDFDGGGGSGGSTVTIDPPAGGGSITITQYDTPPESLPFPGNALNLWFDIDATSYSGGWPVDVTFTWDTPDPVGNSDPILVVSTDGGTSWQEVTTATNWQLAAPSYLVEFTVNEFSWFVMGNGDDNPLPVTLTNFAAQFVGGSPVLCWTTQSESNNIGWNVYRSESENQGQMIQINFNLIPGAGTTSIPTDYIFEDGYEVVVNNTYYYWIESVDYSGGTCLYGAISLSIPEEETPPPLPTITLLRGNYPNPFNPTTTIQFDIKEGETAELTIFNIRGQIVESKTFEAGAYNYEWNSKDNSSGVYFYKLKSDSYSEFKKMMILK